MSKKANPIAGLIINGLAAGIPAIIQAVKAKKAKKAMATANAVAEAANGQLGTAILGATALNAPQLLMPDIPPEILNAPLWLQGIWIGFAASGIILRIVALFLKMKATRPPQKNSK